MRSRSYLSLAVLAVAFGCTSVGDNSTLATAPDVGGPNFSAGVKPPPPLGTEETTINLLSPSSETPDFGEGVVSGPSAESFANLPFSAFHVLGRYFANNASTNGWVQFVSGNGIVASANAKLEYNQKNGKTTGIGTLTADGVVLDLSKIQITSGFFGKCSSYPCASVLFSYDGIPGGTFKVYPPSE